MSELRQPGGISIEQSTHSAMVGLLHLFWGEKGRLLWPRSSLRCRTSTAPLGWARLTSLSIQQCLTMKGFTQKVPILKTNTPTHHSPHFPLSPRTKPSSIPVSLELSHNLRWPDSQFEVTRLQLTSDLPSAAERTGIREIIEIIQLQSIYSPSIHFQIGLDSPLKNNEKICSPEFSCDNISWKLSSRQILQN